MTEGNEREREKVGDKGRNAEGKKRGEKAREVEVGESKRLMKLKHQGYLFQGRRKLISMKNNNPQRWATWND